MTLQVFLLFMSITYLVKCTANIFEVFLSRRGKVDFGKNGQLYVMVAFSYIATVCCVGFIN